MDRPGVCQVPEESGEQRKMEKTGCEVTRVAPTTPQLRDGQDEGGDFVGQCVGRE